MAKPITETMAKHIQLAVAELEGVIAGHVQNNPKLAKEEQIAKLVDGLNLSGLATGVTLSGQEFSGAQAGAGVAQKTEITR